MASHTLPPKDIKLRGEAEVAAVANVGLVALNLGVFLLTVTSASLWLLAYTELFPLIGGFLGLGGAFAWIGLASNLMTEERSKQVKAWFDRNVLQRCRTTVVILVLAGVFVVVGPLTTTALRLSSETGAASVTVTIKESDGTERRVIVAAADPRTIPVAVGWKNTATITIETDALPALSVTVDRFQRKQIEIPTTFWSQPAVLIRASPQCLKNIEDFPVRLRIEVTNASGTGATVFDHAVPYGGNSVWLGTGKALPLPPDRLKALQDSLVIEEVPRPTKLATVGRQTVLFATASKDPSPLINRLAFGQTVSAWTCRNRGKECQKPKETMLASTTLHAGGPFPREIVLEDCTQ